MTGGQEAKTRRAVIGCLELNGLPAEQRDLDLLTTLWPLMRTLAESLYDVVPQKADEHE